VIRLAVVVVALVIGAGVLWGAGELHYRSCVDAAEARTPIVKTRSTFGGVAIVSGRTARKRAVEGCSRLPF
jgi:hypothetical protein